MLEPHCSNFRVITTIFWVSEYLGNLRYNGNIQAFSETKVEITNIIKLPILEKKIHLLHSADKRQHLCNI